MKAETLGGLLALARRQFSDAGIETAALDARLLLQAATDFTHEDLIATPDGWVEPRAAVKFQEYIGRRLAHEPVSRILGEREFYGRKFKVTPDVLDPRPDTEVVVELALKHLPSGRFVDLGTGSGAIAITLCAENPNLSGWATDISQAALDVAKANAQSAGVAERLAFHQGNWLETVSGTFDLIISNPPYIGTGENLPPEVCNFDPQIALFAEEDGLGSYRVISGQSLTQLTTKGIVIVEIGSTQHESVGGIFKDTGFELFDMAKDLSGNTRALAFRTL